VSPSPLLELLEELLPGWAGGDADGLLWVAGCLL
jgi:hypothetical protein